MIKKILERLEEEETKWNDIYELDRDRGGRNHYAAGRKRAFTEAIEIVQEVAKEYDWIPVETELPKKSGRYTVTEEILSLNGRNKVIGTRVAYEVQYDAQNEIWCRANTLRVIAWMPLPITPYQKGE